MFKKVLNYIGVVDFLIKNMDLQSKELFVHHWKFKPAIQQFAELVNIAKTA